MLGFVQLGNFIHYMATFVSGFVVGFTAVWQLALVTLAVVPMIAVIGGIHTTTLAKLSSKSQEALSQAGNIVEQVKNKCMIGFTFLAPKIDSGRVELILICLNLKN